MRSDEHLSLVVELGRVVQDLDDAIHQAVAVCDNADSARIAITRDRDAAYTTFMAAFSAYVDGNPISVIEPHVRVVVDPVHHALDLSLLATDALPMYLDVSDDWLLEKVDDRHQIFKHAATDVAVSVPVARFSDFATLTELALLSVAAAEGKTVQQIILAVSLNKLGVH